MKISSKKTLAIISIPVWVFLLAACTAESSKIAQKPDCVYAAKKVVEMLKDRDTTYSAKIVHIENLEKVEDAEDKFTCRGKGTFSDDKIAPVLVNGHVYNGKWYFQTEQGSHLK